MGVKGMEVVKGVRGWEGCERLGCGKGVRWEGCEMGRVWGVRGWDVRRV